MSSLFPLTVRGAVTRRRGKRLVGPIDWTWDGQGTQAVVGPNGAGKTTLLRLLHGIARLHEGEISWACGTKAAQNAQAFVFQQPVMLRRSVLDNLIYPLRLNGTPRDEAKHLAESWAKKVGLENHTDRSALGLSGGEQQKLAIARALIGGPELVFFDEPTASLDGRATREIETILATAASDGTRIILSTHDMGQAKRLASNIVFLLHGRVHESARADTFFDAPQTREARAFLNGDILE
ncbi:MAG: ATP-binding cassette domain-containing protein [Pseudomonadota bacterium]